MSNSTASATSSGPASGTAAGTPAGGTVAKTSSAAATTTTGASSNNSDKKNDSGGKKVGLIGLIAVVISAMVGGGIYDLPQNMAASASAGGQIIAWVITGVGMWFIANTFRILAQARPELKNGLYTYAYKGFGKFVGFLISYGYWICNCFALVAYGVLIMSTMDFFFPGVFTGGNNWWSIIGASVISWIMLWLALRGAKSGAFLNIIGTIGKILPVLMFIVLMITVFQFGTFLHGFWGLTSSGVQLGFNFGNVMSQVSGTMLVTLWLFIGIEGAVVISGEAKSQSDVSKATTIGYLVILVLYVLVSLLPLGVYSYTDIGKMADPSMATIMQQLYGSWGSDIVNVGVIISVLSSWLVWMLMLGQMPLFASRDGIFPKTFKKTNSKNAPTTSLLWTAIICQALFILCKFVSGNAWNTMISITSVMAMPCYLLCCLFLWKIAVKDPWPKGIRFSRKNAIATGVIGTIFALYLVYSAGLNYLMIACVLYAVGIPLFIVGRRQAVGHDGTSWWNLFTKWEKVLFVIIVVAGIVGIIYTIGSGVFTS
ncbi:basic amino acid/polyamine antiporter [Bifidobacterium choloepi]|uniref:Amino acid permease n=1 Tax=Bifidobacterium choloepi TaxID=2614131 RepID=A0A6I5NJS2_9BIFI|nr:basic amino acid/polyamine antiporter [Bifidobacterium choloepi]NEG70633.1 amino acid permease [Bifidobacterium choloepi]